MALTRGKAEDKYAETFWFENLEFNPAPQAQKTMEAFASNIAKAAAAAAE